MACDHKFREFYSSLKSSGKITVLECNNCAAVKVIQRVYISKGATSMPDEKNYETIVDPETLDPIT